MLELWLFGFKYPNLVFKSKITSCLILPIYCLAIIVVKHFRIINFIFCAQKIDQMQKSFTIFWDIFICQVMQSILNLLDKGFLGGGLKKATTKLQNIFSYCFITEPRIFTWKQKPICILSLPPCFGSWFLMMEQEVEDHF